MTENIVVNSAEDLNKIFGHDETRKSIADKFVMPRPGDGGKAVRILYTKNSDNSLGVVSIVKNDKFKDGQGIFMNVADVEQPEIELQMSLSKSMFNSIDRMCNSEGWKLTDLPNKVIHITANWYPKIKCNQCNGLGCDKCDGTGNSTVFNVRARHDLMSATGAAKKKADEF